MQAKTKAPMEKAASLLNAAPATAKRNASNEQARAKQRVILSNAAFAMARQNGTLPPGAVSARMVKAELAAPSNGLAVADYNRAATVAPIKPTTKAGDASKAPSKPLSLAQRIRALSPAGKAKLAQVLASVRAGRVTA